MVELESERDKKEENMQYYQEKADELNETVI